MKVLIALILIGFLGWAGCSKKDSPEASPTPSDAASAPSADLSPQSPAGAPAASRPPKPASAAPPQAQDVNQPLVGSVHDFMTTQLRIFIQKNGRMPNDFTEFASARMDSVPRLPDGLKWAIDEATQEVKVVRK
jgi:hypothetical protein